MKLMMKLGITLGLGCVALAANAVPVTFESPLPLSSVTINNPIIQNNLGDSDSFNDLVFTTWDDNGSPPRILSMTGASRIVTLSPSQNDLDISSTQALLLAPIASLNGGAQPFPYTEMSFATAGQSLTGNFSFQYGTGTGITIQFFSGASQLFFESKIGAPINGAGWRLFENDFGMNQITSVRFFARGAPSTGDNPNDNVFIDNMSINYSHSGVVPEPSTYALMVVGLLGIGFVARRRMS